MGGESQDGNALGGLTVRGDDEQVVQIPKLIDVDGNLLWDIEEFRIYMRNGI